MTRTIATILFLLSAGSAGAAPLGLKEILELAEKNSPELIQFDNSYRRRELEFDNAKSALYPQGSISLTHGLSKSNTPAITDPTLVATTGENNWVSESKLDLTWSIYKNDENWSNFRLARLRRDAEALNRQVFRENFALDLANAYYDLALARILVDVRKQQLDIYKDQQKLIDKLYRQGLKTEQDFGRFRSDTLRAEIDYRDSLQKIQAAHLDLIRRIGQAEALDTGLSFATPQTVDNFEALPDKIDTAANPLLSLASIQTAITQESVGQAKRNVWPQVLLSTGVEYGARNYLSGTSFNDGKFWNWNALLTLQYNFLDWGQARRTVKITEINSQDDELNTKKQTLQLASTTETTRSDVKTLAEEIGLNRELIQLEDKNYTLIQQQYKQGRVAYLDYIDALEKRLSAHVAYDTNYFTHLKLRARIWNLEGHLYEQLKKD